MTRELSIAFQTDKTAQQYIELAKLVDQYDFDAVTVYCDAPYHPSYSPLLLMAPHIKRARLGPATVSPSRITPLDIAANTALLSQLASGGVYVGMSRGAWLADHGIQEIKPPITTVKEAVEVVRYLLEGGQGGYDGGVFQIAEHVVSPYVLPERVPILIGTWGPKLAGIAGELADEVKIGGSANPDVVPVIADYIAAGVERAGREPGSVGIVIGAVCVIDEDRKQARLAARRSVALYLPIVSTLDPTIEVDPEMAERVQGHVNRQEFDDAAKIIPDDLLDRFAISGNMDDVVKQCEGLFEAGVSRIEFGTPHGLEPEHGIRLIGEQIVPALRSNRL